MPVGVLGIAAILLVAAALSEARAKINKRIVLSTLALQAAIAGFALLTPFGQALLAALSAGVQNIIDYAH